MKCRLTVSSIIVVVTVFCSIYFSTPEISYSRSGCCSHHGGVCGCECCDGTSLSAKCAPYYPSCNEETYSPPAEQEEPDCGLNSTYNKEKDTCYCDDGYTPSQDRSDCIVLPTNSHTIDSSEGEDTWECDDGYEKSNDSCIEIEDTETSSESEDNTTSTEAPNTTNQETGNNNADSSNESSFGDVLIGLLCLFLFIGVPIFLIRNRIRQSKEK